MFRRVACLGAIMTTVGLPTTLHAYCTGYDRIRSDPRPDYYSVAQEYRRSYFVVQAHVIGEQWLGEDGKPKALHPPFQQGGKRPWGFDPYIGAFYTVRVERAFLGKPPKTIRLFSENSTGRFWLTPGSNIVAFIFSQKFDSPIGRQWTLDNCGNSTSLPKARTVIRRINAARRKNA